jgi:rRNA pseudouridine-1189 N-methylase Emg1 (Nep1/Mra1 family)
MGIAGSTDIFQAKMSELMSNLEFVRTHLDDLLTITKLDLSDHLDKLKKVLTRLREAGLKLTPTNQNSVPMKWSISNIS